MAADLRAHVAARDAYSMPVEQAIRYERDLQTFCLFTAERRSPRFTGE